MSVYQRWGKRSFDIVLGSVLALLSLPLIVLLSIASFLALRAWPIFVQPRVGRHGRLFRCLKIRTLPPTAPRAADKDELALIETHWYGRFLRSSHLDELPQLLLVPIGTMSLVGPRPAIPELVDRFHESVFENRSCVRPGCTGLWQVSDAGTGPIYVSPEHDQFYVRNICLKLDAKILARTVVVMLRGMRWISRQRSAQPAPVLPVASAYVLADVPCAPTSPDPPFAVDATSERTRSRSSR